MGLHLRLSFGKRRSLAQERNCLQTEWDKIIGDPFLNYFGLGLLVFVVVVIFCGMIAIHDIPAKIAEARRTFGANGAHAFAASRL